MKFGTLVTVLRGGGALSGVPGCARRVPGVLVGARGCNRRVRLTADDPLDTVGWRRAGDVGWWSCSAVLGVTPEVAVSAHVHKWNATPISRQWRPWLRCACGAWSSAGRVKRGEGPFPSAAFVKGLESQVSKARSP